MLSTAAGEVVLSRMPPELGSMLEPRERGKENHVNNNHQDTQRF